MASRRNRGPRASMIFPVRPEISVIVPVLDGGADFGRCLDALAAAPVSPAWELIVVDVGSTDGSADCARAAGARLLFTAHPRSGPAVARNLGAVAARGEFLLFVDADVLVTPHTVHHMIQAFRAEPSLTAVFGSYDARPASPNFISQYKISFTISSTRPRGPTRQRFGPAAARSAAPCFSISAGSTPATGDHRSKTSSWGTG